MGISETGLKPTISSECVKIKGYICLGLLIIRPYKGGVAMDLMSVCLLMLSFFHCFLIGVVLPHDNVEALESEVFELLPRHSNVDVTLSTAVGRSCNRHNIYVVIILYLRSLMWFINRIPFCIIFL